MHRFKLFSVRTAQVVTAIVITTILAVGGLNAQSWIIEETFGGNTSDFGFNGVTTADGGHVHIGNTTSFGNPLTVPNIHVVRVDAVAAPVWEMVYDYTAVNFEMSIIEAVNGDLVWTTGVFAPGSATADMLVVRTTAVGVPVWAILVGFGSGTNEVSASVIEAANGDIVVAGFSDATGATDAMVARITAAGVLLWSQTYGSPVFDNGRCVREDLPTGDLLIAGETTAAGTGDGLMFRITGAGALIWSHAYGGLQGDGFSTLILSGNNSVYACGVWNDPANTDIYVVNANAATGAQVAAATYSTPYFGQEGAWFINNSGTPGNFVVSGQAGNQFGGIEDAFAMEITPTLGLVWFREYGFTPGGFFDVGRSINYTPGAAAPFTQGGYWILGYTDAYGAGMYDHYLIRTNLVGKSGCDFIPPVNVLPRTPNIPIAFNQTPFGINLPQVIPFNPVASLQIHCPGQYVGPFAPKQGGEDNLGEEAAVTSTSSLGVFPNPVQANNVMMLEFNSTMNAEALITVSDLQGRVLLETRYDAREGMNSYSFATGNWSSGMYSVRVQGAGVSQVTTVSVLD